tara:strand:+ start:24 stop:542 length:519 start_codon:yes stop_codon:yes gene_type:complete
MKTFSQFCCEAYYDTDKPSDTPLKVGRVGKDRRKSDAERKRYTKSGGYKDRKDVGTNKPKSQTVQQPEKERGSAGLSSKEAQRKAYRERKARESGAKTKSASQLLSKKTEKKVDPKYKAQKARFSGPDARAKRQKLMRSGERELEKSVRDSEAKKQGKSPKDVKLKNFKKSW